MVFDLLAGRTSSRAQSAPEFLRHKISRATPNDAVVVLYSGHAEKDAKNIFRIFPFDTDKDKTPDRLISSLDIASWMRDVDAGEVILLLDACHSGAATGVDFRPGPMGDPGLGQLAYDKGMRILAATQPDGVAIGSGVKRNGILTDHLIEVGLHQNAADVGKTFDWYAWLRFGSKRTQDLDPELFDFSPDPAPN
jgi:uncharacterized caspase-like protein